MEGDGRFSGRSAGLTLCWQVVEIDAAIHRSGILRPPAPFQVPV